VNSPGWWGRVELTLYFKASAEAKKGAEQIEDREQRDSHRPIHRIREKEQVAFMVRPSNPTAHDPAIDLVIIFPALSSPSLPSPPISQQEHRLQSVSSARF
jgi:hypothetical protein